MKFKRRPYRYDSYKCTVIDKMSNRRPAQIYRGCSSNRENWTNFGSMHKQHYDGTTNCNNVIPISLSAIGCNRLRDSSYLHDHVTVRSADTDLARENRTLLPCAEWLYRHSRSIDFLRCLLTYKEHRGPAQSHGWSLPPTVSTAQSVSGVMKMKAYMFKPHSSYAMNTETAIFHRVSSSCELWTQLSKNGNFVG